jgi:hypothetical protein
MQDLSLFSFTINKQTEEFFPSLCLLKGHGIEQDLFCINRFGIGPLHNLSSRSDFDFESAEISLIENRLPASVSRGVDKIELSDPFFKPLNK